MKSTQWLLLSPTQSKQKQKGSGGHTDRVLSVITHTNDLLSHKLSKTRHATIYLYVRSIIFFFFVLVLILRETVYVSGLQRFFLGKPDSSLGSRIGTDGSNLPSPDPSYLQSHLICTPVHRAKQKWFNNHVGSLSQKTLFLLVSNFQIYDGLQRSPLFYI